MLCFINLLHVYPLITHHYNWSAQQIIDQTDQPSKFWSHFINSLFLKPLQCVDFIKQQRFNN